MSEAKLWHSQGPSISQRDSLSALLGGETFDAQLESNFLVLTHQ